MVRLKLVKAFHLTAGMRRVAALLALFTVAFAVRAADLSATNLAAKLDALNETIAAELAANLKAVAPKTSYTTVWRQFEDTAIDALEKVLPRHIPELTATNFDSGKSGREKNRLADLAVICPDGQIEISIKTARRGANPENDMGTFHEHALRRKLFTASFTLWLRYDDTGAVKRIDGVFFDRTWRFVGKSSLVDGVKYRKKDGNMRPKPWAMFDTGESYWKSEEDFEAAVKQSEVYRANSLVGEHLRDLSEEDQRVLYERLRQKFGDGQGGAP